MTAAPLTTTRGYRIDIISSRSIYEPGRRPSARPPGRTRVPTPGAGSPGGGAGRQGGVGSHRHPTRRGRYIHSQNKRNH